MDIAVIRLERQSTPSRGHRQCFTMGDSPIAITGIQCLVQTLVVLMLSAPGSDPLAQSDGIDLLGILQSAGRGLDDQRADAIMAYSMLRQQVIDMQSGEEMPDDERLQDLEVLRIYLDGSRFVHVLKVTSVAGTTVTFDTKDLFLE